MTRRRGFPALALVFFASIACVGLTSCTGAKDDQSDAPQKNQEQWSLPLDEFRIYNPQLGNYADQLIIGKCLAEAGYDWPVPWQDTNFPQPPDFNSQGLRLFNKKTAQQWGYHFAPPQNVRDIEAWEAASARASSYNPDAAFQGKFDDCRKVALKGNPEKYVDGFNLVNGLAAQASDVSRQDESVQKALPKWRECLSSKVSFAIPSNPWSADMPPASVQEQFGLAGSAKTATASAEEITAAVADADCRESSGLAAALYTAEWNEEQALVDKNRDKLDRIRTEAVAHKKEILKIVAANAPAAP